MKEPEDLPLLEHDFHHEDLSNGGIYTNSELEAWKKHLELGDYQDAVTKLISYGVCTHRGDCEATSNTPQYNLQNLSPGSWIQLSFWKRLDTWIQSYTTYICLLVLLIESAKLCAFLLILAQTMIRDGIAGVQAVLYLLCCGAMRHSEKVARRHQRLKKKKNEEELLEQPEAGEKHGLFTR